MNRIAKQINEHFAFLVNEFKFIKKEEKFDNDNFSSITFEIPLMGVTLEKYFTEIYMHVFKCTNPEDKIDIYNLLNYLNRDKNKFIKSNYFRREKNNTKRISLQIKWLAELLKRNLSQIMEFVSDDCFNQYLSEITKYVIQKNPDLFKNIKDS